MSRPGHPIDPYGPEHVEIERQRGDFIGMPQMSLNRRMCLRCLTVKPTKGGSMRGPSFVCSDCKGVKK